MDRALEIIRITLPVFAAMGLGKWLDHRGAIKRTHRDFINSLTFNYCLPALIFISLASQTFSGLMRPSLIFGTLAAVVISAALFTAVGVWVLKYEKGLAAAFGFSPFWANVSYLGFPLAARAFGEDDGLALAAIVNAFTMPAFVVIGFGLIAGFTGRGGTSIRSRAEQSVLNPIVSSAAAGLVVSAALGLLRNESGVSIVPQPLQIAGMMLRDFLLLIGRMGLPLALISVGASLRPAGFRRYGLPVGIATLGKLVVTPLIVLLFIKIFFSEAESAVRGAAVMLMGTPTALGCYVVSRQYRAGDDFIAVLLVATTALSVVTIPMWLWFLL